jgi:hypothetical protein
MHRRLILLTNLPYGRYGEVIESLHPKLAHLDNIIRLRPCSGIRLFIIDGQEDVESSTHVREIFDTIILSDVAVFDHQFLQ